ncbi:hypothetical protein V2E24_01350 [Mycoplasmopsis ciconiae]|uniref:Extracellular matrix-binding protein ebh GA module domain-containing protein n=1 Tax=Mycoplasmopsis ciconiae TaxID=561067 RepID=A0ABU7ML84_9BACT|nr:hypothetical protein [Mycoplasmopsis ciconiae]
MNKKQFFKKMKPIIKAGILLSPSLSIASILTISNNGSSEGAAQEDFDRTWVPIDVPTTPLNLNNHEDKEQHSHNVSYQRFNWFLQGAEYYDAKGLASSYQTTYPNGDPRRIWIPSGNSDFLTNQKNTYLNANNGSFDKSIDSSVKVYSSKTLYEKWLRDKENFYQMQVERNKKLPDQNKKPIIPYPVPQPQTNTPQYYWGKFLPNVFDPTSQQWEVELNSSAYVKFNTNSVNSYGSSDSDIPGFIPNNMNFGIVISQDMEIVPNSLIMEFDYNIKQSNWGISESFRNPENYQNREGKIIWFANKTAVDYPQNNPWYLKNEKIGYNLSGSQNYNANNLLSTSISSNAESVRINQSLTTPFDIDYINSDQKMPLFKRGIIEYGNQIEGGVYLNKLNFFTTANPNGGTKTQNEFKQLFLKNLGIPTNNSTNDLVLNSLNRNSSQIQNFDGDTSLLQTAGHALTGQIGLGPLNNWDYDVTKWQFTIPTIKIKFLTRRNRSPFNWIWPEDIKRGSYVGAYTYFPKNDKGNAKIWQNNTEYRSIEPQKEASFLRWDFKSVPARKISVEQPREVDFKIKNNKYTYKNPFNKNENIESYPSFVPQMDLSVFVKNNNGTKQSFLIIKSPRDTNLFSEINYNYRYLGIKRGLTTNDNDPNAYWKRVDGSGEFDDKYKPFFNVSRESYSNSQPSENELKALFTNPNQGNVYSQTNFFLKIHNASNKLTLNINLTDKGIRKEVLLTSIYQNTLIENPNSEQLNLSKNIIKNYPVKLEELSNVIKNDWTNSHYETENIPKWYQDIFNLNNIYKTTENNIADASIYKNPVSELNLNSFQDLIQNSDSNLNLQKSLNYKFSSNSNKEDFDQKTDSLNNSIPNTPIQRNNSTEYIDQSVFDALNTSNSDYISSRNQLNGIENLKSLMSQVDQLNNLNTNLKNAIKTGIINSENYQSAQAILESAQNLNNQYNNSKLLSDKYVLLKNYLPTNNQQLPSQITSEDIIRYGYSTSERKSVFNNSVNVLNNELQQLQSYSHPNSLNKDEIDNIITQISSKTTAATNAYDNLDGKTNKPIIEALQRQLVEKINEANKWNPGQGSALKELIDSSTPLTTATLPAQNETFESLKQKLEEAIKKFDPLIEQEKSLKAKKDKAISDINAIYQLVNQEIPQLEKDKINNANSTNIDQVITEAIATAKVTLNTEIDKINSLNTTQKDKLKNTYKPVTIKEASQMQQAFNTAMQEIKSASDNLVNGLTFISDSQIKTNLKNEFNKSGEPQNVVVSAQNFLKVLEAVKTKEKELSSTFTHLSSTQQSSFASQVQAINLDSTNVATLTNKLNEVYNSFNDLNTAYKNLNDKIQQYTNPDVKQTAKYKLADELLKQAYDRALNDAQTLNTTKNKNNSSEVNAITSALERAYNALNGDNFSVDLSQFQHITNKTSIDTLAKAQDSRTKANQIVTNAKTLDTSLGNLKQKANDLQANINAFETNNTALAPYIQQQITSAKEKLNSANQTYNNNSAANYTSLEQITQNNNTTTAKASELTPLITQLSPTKLPNLNEIATYPDILLPNDKKTEYISNIINLNNANTLANDMAAQMTNATNAAKTNAKAQIQNAKTLNNSEKETFNTNISNNSVNSLSATKTTYENAVTLARNNLGTLIEKSNIADKNKFKTDNKFDQADTIQKINDIYDKLIEQARSEANKTINSLENLSDQEKRDFEAKVNQADSVDAINKLIEDAKALNQKTQAINNLKAIYQLVNQLAPEEEINKIQTANADTIANVITQTLNTAKGVLTREIDKLNTLTQNQKQTLKQSYASENITTATQMQQAFNNAQSQIQSSANALVDQVDFLDTSLNKQNIKDIFNQENQTTKAPANVVISEQRYNNVLSNVKEKLQALGDTFTSLTADQRGSFKQEITAVNVNSTNVDVSNSNASNIAKTLNDIVKRYKALNDIKKQAIDKLVTLYDSNNINTSKLSKQQHDQLRALIDQANDVASVEDVIRKMDSIVTINNYEHLSVPQKNAYEDQIINLTKKDSAQSYNDAFASINSNASSLNDLMKQTKDKIAEINDANSNAKDSLNNKLSTLGIDTAAVNLVKDKATSIAQIQKLNPISQKQELINHFVDIAVNANDTNAVTQNQSNATNLNDAYIALNNKIQEYTTSNVTETQKYKLADQNLKDAFDSAFNASKLLNTNKTVNDAQQVQQNLQALISAYEALNGDGFRPDLSNIKYLTNKDSIAKLSKEQQSIEESQQIITIAEKLDRDLGALIDKNQALTNNLNSFNTNNNPKLSDLISSELAKATSANQAATNVINTVKDAEYNNKNLFNTNNELVNSETTKVDPLVTKFSSEKLNDLNQIVNVSDILLTPEQKTQFVNGILDLQNPSTLSEDIRTKATEALTSATNNAKADIATAKTLDEQQKQDFNTQATQQSDLNSLQSVFDAKVQQAKTNLGNLIDKSNLADKEGFKAQHDFNGANTIKKINDIYDQLISQAKNEANNTISDLNNLNESQKQDFKDKVTAAETIDQINEQLEAAKILSQKTEAIENLKAIYQLVNQELPQGEIDKIEQATSQTINEVISQTLATAKNVLNTEVDKITSLTPEQKQTLKDAYKDQSVTKATQMNGAFNDSMQQIQTNADTLVDNVNFLKESVDKNAIKNIFNTPNQPTNVVVSNQRYNDVLNDIKQKAKELANDFTSLTTTQIQNFKDAIDATVANSNNIKNTTAQNKNIAQILNDIVKNYKDLNDIKKQAFDKLREIYQPTNSTALINEEQNSKLTQLINDANDVESVEDVIRKIDNIIQLNQYEYLSLPQKDNFENQIINLDKNTSQESYTQAAQNINNNASSLNDLMKQARDEVNKINDKNQAAKTTLTSEIEKLDVNNDAVNLIKNKATSIINIQNLSEVSQNQTLVDKFVDVALKATSNPAIEQNQTNATNLNDAYTRLNNQINQYTDPNVKDTQKYKLADDALKATFDSALESSQMLKTNKNLETAQEVQANIQALIDAYNALNGDNFTVNLDNIHHLNNKDSIKQLALEQPSIQESNEVVAKAQELDDNLGKLIEQSQQLNNNLNAFEMPDSQPNPNQKLNEFIQSKIDQAKADLAHTNNLINDVKNQAYTTKELINDKNTLVVNDSTKVDPIIVKFDPAKLEDLNDIANVSDTLLSQENKEEYINNIIDLTNKDTLNEDIKNQFTQALDIAKTNANNEISKAKTLNQQEKQEFNTNANSQNKLSDLENIFDNQVQKAKDNLNTLIEKSNIANKEEFKTTNHFDQANTIDKINEIYDKLVEQAKNEAQQTINDLTNLSKEQKDELIQKVKDASDTQQNINTIDQINEILEEANNLNDQELANAKAKAIEEIKKINNLISNDADYSNNAIEHINSAQNIDEVKVNFEQEVKNSINAIKDSINNSELDKVNDTESQNTFEQVLNDKLDQLLDPQNSQKIDVDNAFNNINPINSQALDELKQYIKDQINGSNIADKTTELNKVDAPENQNINALNELYQQVVQKAKDEAQNTLDNLRSLTEEEKQQYNFNNKTPIEIKQELDKAIEADKNAKQKALDALRESVANIEQNYNTNNDPSSDKPALNEQLLQEFKDSQTLITNATSENNGISKFELDKQNLDLNLAELKQVLEKAKSINNPIEDLTQTITKVDNALENLENTPLSVEEVKILRDQLLMNISKDKLAKSIKDSETIVQMIESLIDENNNRNSLVQNQIQKTNEQIAFVSDLIEKYNQEISAAQQATNQNPNNLNTNLTQYLNNLVDSKETLKQQLKNLQEKLSNLEQQQSSINQNISDLTQELNTQKQTYESQIQASKDLLNAPISQEDLNNNAKLKELQNNFDAQAATQDTNNTASDSQNKQTLNSWINQLKEQANNLSVKSVTINNLLAQDIQDYDAHQLLDYYQKLKQALNDDNQFNNTVEFANNLPDKSTNLEDTLANVLQNIENVTISTVDNTNALQNAINSNLDQYQNQIKQNIKQNLINKVTTAENFDLQISDPDRVFNEISDDLKQAISQTNELLDNPDYQNNSIVDLEKALDNITNQINKEKLLNAINEASHWLPKIDSDTAEDKQKQKELQDVLNEAQEFINSAHNAVEYNAEAEKLNAQIEIAIKSFNQAKELLLNKINEAKEVEPKTQLLEDSIALSENTYENAQTIKELIDQKVDLNKYINNQKLENLINQVTQIQNPSQDLTQALEDDKQLLITPQNKDTSTTTNAQLEEAIENTDYRIKSNNLQNVFDSTKDDFPRSQEYQNAIDQSEQILNDPLIKKDVNAQNIYDEQAAKLQLIKDRNELINLINKANNVLDPSVELSQEIFAAQNVVKNPDSTNQEIKDEIVRLTVELNLNDLINQYNKSRYWDNLLNPTTQTDALSVKQNLNTQTQKALNIINNYRRNPQDPNISKDVIDAQTQNLKDANQASEDIIVEAKNNLINLIKTTENLSEFSQQLTQALKEAKELVAKEELQKYLDYIKMFELLNDAINKNNLALKVVEANELNPKNQDLINAIDFANEVLNKPNASKEEIQEALDKLDQALKQNIKENRDNSAQIFSDKIDQLNNLSQLEKDSFKEQIKNAPYIDDIEPIYNKAKELDQTKQNIINTTLNDLNHLNTDQKEFVKQEIINSVYDDNNLVEPFVNEPHTNTDNVITQAKELDESMLKLSETKDIVSKIDLDNLNASDKIKEQIKNALEIIDNLNNNKVSPEDKFDGFTYVNKPNANWNKDEVDRFNSEIKNKVKDLYTDVIDNLESLSEQEKQDFKDQLNNLDFENDLQNSINQANDIIKNANANNHTNDLMNQVVEKLDNLNNNYNENDVNQTKELLEQISDESKDKFKEEANNLLETLDKTDKLNDALEEFKNTDVSDEKFDEVKQNLIDAINELENSIKQTSEDKLNDVANKINDKANNLIDEANKYKDITDAIINKDADKYQEIIDKTKEDIFNTIKEAIDNTKAFEEFSKESITTKEKDKILEELDKYDLPTVIKSAIIASLPIVSDVNYWWLLLLLLTIPTGLLIWWFIILAKRKKEDEEEQQN